MSVDFRLLRLFPDSDAGDAFSFMLLALLSRRRRSIGDRFNDGTFKNDFERCLLKVGLTCSLSFYVDIIALCYLNMAGSGNATEIFLGISRIGFSSGLVASFFTTEIEGRLGLLKSLT